MVHPVQCVNSTDRLKEYRLAVLVRFFIYSSEVLLYFIRARNRFFLLQGSALECPWGPGSSGIGVVLELLIEGTLVM